MACKSTSRTSANRTPSDHYSVATSRYSYQQLADIYNQTRIDYIVPMPMNARRMQEYVEHYDIDLDASVVAIDTEDDEVNGIAMLGIRGDQSWITRLGVIPERRRRHTGQFLMDSLIDQACERGCSTVQLEVIKGNDPAFHLFQKLGFEPVRDLLVVRRPPNKLDERLSTPDGEMVEPIDDDVEAYLREREPGASWVEDTPSLLNAGNLRGMRVQRSDGEVGWVVLRRTPFQLQHIVISPNISDDMTLSLLSQVHQRYPLQDTKVENIPADHPTWRVFKLMGYFESFSRIEMILDL